MFRPEDFFNTKTRGDTYFGFDEWLIVKKLDKDKIKEIYEALLKKALKDEVKLTIHKVWKLKAVIRIPLKISGMFGMDPINVLDLTDSKLITIITKEDEEPVSSNYSIVDNEITIEKFQDRLKFRIEELGVSELKLILHIDLQVNKQQTIKGAILEMIFEVYK